MKFPSCWSKWLSIKTIKYSLVIILFAISMALLAPKLASSLHYLNQAANNSESLTKKNDKEELLKKNSALKSSIQPSEFPCLFTEEKIVIDGKINETAWQEATVIDQFHLPWLGKIDRAARSQTKARLLWDREYLYFCAEMQDTDLFADVTEHDGVTWDNDVFELFFKPAEDKPGYYEFQVNAAGTIMDLFLPRRGAGGYRRFKSDGEFHIEAKVSLDGTLNHWQDKDRSWTVEGKIPWKDFMRTGGRPNPGETWRFSLCRYDYSVDFEGPEVSNINPHSTIPYPDFHHYEDYAKLKFLGPGKKATRAYGIPKKIPLLSSKVVGSPEPPTPYRAVRQYSHLGIDFPITVIAQPNSPKLLFLTQSYPYGDTVLRRVDDRPDAKDAEILLEMKGTGYSLAFDPHFAENGYLYMGWNGVGSNQKKQSMITRYTMSRKAPYNLDKNSATTIIAWDSDGHNGAALCFGLDGMLYITSGDGTSDSDRNIVGQDGSKITAKVLRIQLSNQAPAQKTESSGKNESKKNYSIHYSIPSDNPFLGNKDFCPETWAYGLRNPWRMTVDAKTGQIWVGNNGQDLWEQIYLIRKGENYGWSVYEGSKPFYQNRKLGPTPVTFPVLEHHHSEARSITGGLVYYGKRFPDLQGWYIYGDYSTGRIWAARHDGKKITGHRLLAKTRLQITGFGLDSQGEILICDHLGQGKGGFYTLEPNPEKSTADLFPKKLSQSGLFRDISKHEMMPGIIPYSVNAPFWSDGAYKERWMALPGEDPVIGFTRSRGWNFPDKTVIVKSFALEMEEGNPHSRRWIETRFLTKQGSEWFGYSYQWNSAQTDANLVESIGMDREFVIKTGNENRIQKWHYPSRAECMVCHSRAANWVLGLCELQLNKEHNYNGISDHQFRTLEHLGLLQVDWQSETQEAIKKELRAKGMTEKAINTYLDQQWGTRDQRLSSPGKMLSFSLDKYSKLVDPADHKQDIGLRARSFLHANCSSCHVEAGGGNSKIDLEFTTSLEKMLILDQSPSHHTFALPNARLVAPGHPESSVLLHRIAQRREGFMPPLATYAVDPVATQVIQDWIKQLKPTQPSKPNKSP